MRFGMVWIKQTDEWGGLVRGASWLPHGPIWVWCGFVPITRPTSNRELHESPSTSANSAAIQRSPSLPERSRSRCSSAGCRWAHRQPWVTAAAPPSDSSAAPRPPCSSTGLLSQHRRTPLAAALTAPTQPPADGSNATSSLQHRRTPLAAAPAAPTLPRVVATPPPPRSTALQHRRLSLAKPPASACSTAGRRLQQRRRPWSQ